MVEIPQMGWYDEPEQPVGSITVDALDKMCDEVFAQREATEKAREAYKLQDEKLSQLEAKLLSMLTQSGKNSWKTDKALFSKMTRFSVQTPKTMEEKLQFFDYLKQKGVFEEMVNVHSQTLNSFYKQEQEIAAKEGRLLQIPGLKEPTASETLSMRRS